MSLPSLVVAVWIRLHFGLPCLLLDFNKKGIPNKEAPSAGSQEDDIRKTSKE